VTGERPVERAEWTHDDGLDFILAVEPLTSAKARLAVYRAYDPTVQVGYSLISPDEAQSLADAVRRACHE
jgi:hypothetical protein